MLHFLVVAEQSILAKLAELASLGLEVYRVKADLLLVDRQLVLGLFQLLLLLPN